jgi:hypothetical protein
MKYKVKAENIKKLKKLIIELKNGKQHKLGRGLYRDFKK